MNDNYPRASNPWLAASLAHELPSLTQAHSDEARRARFIDRLIERMAMELPVGITLAEANRYARHYSGLYQFELLEEDAIGERILSTMSSYVRFGLRV